MQNCTKISVRKAYHRYVGLLPKKDGDEMYEHSRGCKVCESRILAVTELMEGFCHTTQEEELFAVRLFVNPVFEDCLDRALEGITEEIKTELKAEISTEIEKLACLANQPSKSQQKTNFQVITLILILGLFSILTTATYHTLRQPATISLPVVAPHMMIELNLYERLDAAIDLYLQGAALGLDEAKTIAEQIKIRNSDPYGLELVAYYSSVSKEKIEPLKEYRLKLKELSDYPAGSDYKRLLGEAKKLQESFLVVGDKLEALKTKTLIVKFSLLDYKTDTSLIAVEATKEAEAYPYLKNYFLLWESKSYLDTKEQETGISLLNQVIESSSKLHLYDIEVSAVKSRVTLLHNEDKDEDALSLAYSVLFKVRQYQIKVALLQICGASAFKLGHEKFSNTYMKEALELAQEHNNYYLVGLTHTWRGIMLSEKGNHTEAETCYELALSYLGKIDNEASQKDLLAKISGYQAKNKFRQGDYEAAAANYQESIRIFTDLNRQNYLEMSQLNDGLAIARSKTKKDSDKYYAIASFYQEKAESQRQKTNCLFSFFPQKSCG